MPHLALIGNLSIAFGGYVVIRDLSGTLPAQGLTAILGRSGSGKTTFLRAFNRLNEEFPGCETRGADTPGFRRHSLACLSPTGRKQ